MLKVLILLFVVVSLASCSGGGEAGILDTRSREERNFDMLCEKPGLTCIETATGWKFRGQQYLIDEVCETENTGIVCE